MKHGKGSRTAGNFTLYKYTLWVRGLTGFVFVNTMAVIHE